MCIFEQPKMAKMPDAPKRESVIGQEDTAALAAEQEKKRKGFSSTVATSGMGLMDTANIRKVTLGS